MSIRPPLLDKILTIALNREEEDKLIYKQFINLCYNNNNNNNNNNSKRITKDTLNSTSNNNNNNNNYNNNLKVTFQWLYSNDPILNSSNCSLCSIFYFYCKVQLPQTKLHIPSKKLTSDLENISRESLSFFELILLCRDFRIIPKLMSKEELSFLYKLITSIKKSKRSDNLLLEFNDFLELFGRIAIVVFNKPMIKHIIETNRDRMLTYEEQIAALAYYLHLDDYSWVKNRLDTVSANTVTMINLRSENEINALTKDILREDIKGKRLTRWLATGDIHTTASGLQHMNIRQMNDILQSTHYNEHFGNELQSQLRSNTQQSNIKSPINSQPQSPRLKQRYERQKLQRQQKQMQDEQRIKETPTLLDEVIEKMKQAGEWNLETDENNLSEQQLQQEYEQDYQYQTQTNTKFNLNLNLNTITNTNINTNNNTNTNTNTNTNVQSRKNTSYLNTFKSTQLQQLQQSQQFPLVAGIKLSQTQENALLQYLPVYTTQLQQYSNLTLYRTHQLRSSSPSSSLNSTTSTSGTSTFTPGDQCRGQDISLLDMGIVEEERDIILKMHITNQTEYEIQLDIQVNHNFCPSSSVSEMRLTSLPHPIAPGLTKTVYLTYRHLKDQQIGHKNYFYQIQIHTISTQLLNTATQTALRNNMNTTTINTGNNTRINSAISQYNHTNSTNKAYFQTNYYVFSRIISPNEATTLDPNYQHNIYKLFPICNSKSIERLYNIQFSSTKTHTPLSTLNNFSTTTTTTTTTRTPKTTTNFNGEDEDEEVKKVLSNTNNYYTPSEPIQYQKSHNRSRPQSANRITGRKLKKETLI